jgi:hypothetical protein
MPELVRNNRYSLIYIDKDGIIRKYADIDARNDDEARDITSMKIKNEKLGGQLLLVRNVSSYANGDPSPQSLFA